MIVGQQQLFGAQLFIAMINHACIIRHLLNVAALIDCKKSPNLTQEVFGTTLNERGGREEGGRGEGEKRTERERERGEGKNYRCHAQFVYLILFIDFVLCVRMQCTIVDSLNFYKCNPNLVSLGKNAVLMSYSISHQQFLFLFNRMSSI